MRIEVDHDRCTGHGRCYDVAEDVFGADDEGHTTLLIEGEIPAEHEKDARLAVLNCPERALTALD